MGFPMPSKEDVEKMQKLFNAMAFISELLPPFELKEIIRTTKDKAGKETKKEYIAIYFERPPKK